MKSQLLPQIL